MLLVWLRLTKLATLESSLSCDWVVREAISDFGSQEAIRFSDLTPFFAIEEKSKFKDEERNDPIREEIVDEVIGENDRNDAIEEADADEMTRKDDRMRSKKRLQMWWSKKEIGKVCYGSEKSERDCIGTIFE